MTVVRHFIKKYLSKCFYSCNSNMNSSSFIPKNAFFRVLEGAETFQMTFRWKSEEMKIEREFNFNRKLSENLESFSERVKSNIERLIEKKVSRKAKKKAVMERLDSPHDIVVKVFADGLEMPGSTKCGEIFFDKTKKSKLQLNISENYYDVIVNPPTIEFIQLPSVIMSEFPVYPSRISIIFGDQKCSSFLWFKEGTPGKWMKVGSGFMYTPTPHDLDCRLKIVCIPSDGVRFGPEVEVISKGKVQAGPGQCPFEAHHYYTKEKARNDSFRVVTYNILADIYAETPAAKMELFPYCPQHAMALDYRKCLLVREILGYNADIICLQEVGKRLFENDLKICLMNEHMDGSLAVKKDINEGVATFFSTKKFKLIKEWRMVMCDEIQSNYLFQLIWQKVSCNEELKKNFLNRGTVLQVLLLESLNKKNEKVLIGNTHLYFSPSADHIRLLQAGMTLIFLKDIINQCLIKNPKDKLSVTLCGDFNSTPECGVYKLMTTKCVPSDYLEWKSQEGEHVEGLTLSHDLNLKSAFGTPDYTNFTVGFKGCLDYIFYQTDCLSVEQVIPLPSLEEMEKNIALPSVVFPSDHIALVADFTWKS